MRIVGHGYDGDLNLTSVTVVDDDEKEYRLEIARHGRWVKAHGMMPPEFHGRKCCSVCGQFAPCDFHGREMLTPGCPYCLAKMDLENKP